MKFISTRTHGLLDYLMGALMIGAPWWLGFHRGGDETKVFVAIGIGVLLYSLFTRYEYGAVKSIRMGTHLALDIIGGAVLALSPWLFGFADYVYAPHVVFGLVEIGTALCTQPHPTLASDSQDEIHAGGSHRSN